MSCCTPTKLPIMLWLTGTTITALACVMTGPPAETKAQRTVQVAADRPTAPTQLPAVGSVRNDCYDGARSGDESPAALEPPDELAFAELGSMFHPLSRRLAASPGAGRFSLELPADLWGVLDEASGDDPDPAGSRLGLAIAWPPSDRRPPDLFPYQLGPRRWRELSPWEQIGVVVQKASAIAGVIYLLYRIF